VYLDEGQLPAFTLSISDVADVSKIRGFRGTTMRILSTKESRRVFGNETVAPIDPNGRKTLRIGNDSVDLFSAQIIKARQDRDEIECQTVSGNATWFEWAKKTKLRDLDLEPTDLVTDSLIQDSWEDEEMMVAWPLIDFGSYQGRASTYDVLRETLRPGLRIHRVLFEAFDSIGYTIGPAGMFTRAWKKLFMHEGAQDALSIAENTGGDIAVENPGKLDGGYQFTQSDTQPLADGIGGPLDNTLEISDPNNRYGPNTLTGKYVLDFDSVIRVTLADLVLRDFGGGAGPGVYLLDGTPLHIQLYNITLDYVMAELVTDPFVAGVDLTFSGVFPDVFIEAGEEITILFASELGAQYTIEVGDADARITYAPTVRPYAVDLQLLPASVCPDMTVMELLMALVNDQCLKVNTNVDAQTITLEYDPDFFRKPSNVITTRDFTRRMDHTTAPAKIYDQRPIRIKFRFKNDGNDALVHKINRVFHTVGYGNRDVEIGGPSSEQSIELPFAATAMATTLGGVLMPAMRKKDGVYQENSYEVEPRLLIFDGVTTLPSGTWRFDGSDLDHYPNCYFVKPEDSYPLAFGNVSGNVAAESYVIEERWSRRIAELQRSRMLECKMKLRDNELTDFDLGMPTLIDDSSGPSWWYVSEIKQHRFGINGTTTCLLTEIPGEDYSLPQNPALSYPSVTFCAGGVRVFGAGTEAVNGIYCPHPTDANVWTKQGGTHYADSLYSEPGLGYWVFTSGGTFGADPENVKYLNTGGPSDMNPGTFWGPTPSAWLVFPGFSFGDEPVPSVLFI